MRKFQVAAQSTARALSVWACNAAVPLSYVARACKQAGEMDEQMIAMVAEGYRKRLFRLVDWANTYQIARARRKPRVGVLEAGILPDQALGFRVQRYGCYGSGSISFS